MPAAALPPEYRPPPHGAGTPAAAVREASPPGHSRLPECVAGLDSAFGADPEPPPEPPEAEPPEDPEPVEEVVVELERVAVAVAEAAAPEDFAWEDDGSGLKGLRAKPWR